MFTARPMARRVFVLDGEAVLLGVDGIADFNGLHSRKHDDEVQLYAFDVLMRRATISGRCRCTCAKTTLPRCCGGDHLAPWRIWL
jgi:bifunctional non-homologous end joining protein LigD